MLLRSWVLVLGSIAVILCGLAFEGSDCPVYLLINWTNQLNSSVFFILIVISD
jgi:hypothetical protein